MQIVCPHCGSVHVNLSQRRGWFDWLFGIFGRKPYRCQLCSTRFFSKLPTGGPA